MTVIGISGLAAALLSGGLSTAATSRLSVLIGICVISLTFIGLDIFRYYSSPQVPGNDYGWVLVIPYCLSLVFVIWRAAIGVAQSDQIDDASAH